MARSCKYNVVWSVAMALWLPLQAVACDFPAGFFVRREVNVGDLFIGRDAPIGTVIKASPHLRSERFHPTGITCKPGSRFDVDSPLPKIFNSPLVPPGDVILQTRIPGIGVVVAGHMSGGSVDNRWTRVPREGFQGWGVPHHATHDTPGVWLGIISSGLYYRFIKIGPVEADMGVQPLAGHILAELTNNIGGRVMEMVITSGSINVAMCGLPGAPATQVTVPMGTWRTGQFRGEGSVTDTQTFNVPVQACQAGTNPRNQNFAALRLDPRNGSSVLDAQRGLLGLNADSDATGVAVQVLKADLTPMPLTEEVQMVRMTNGDLNIPMAARYIQVGTDTPVGGVANASLGFTLTYK